MPSCKILADVPFAIWLEIMKTSVKLPILFRGFDTVSAPSHSDPSCTVGQYTAVYPMCGKRVTVV